MATLRARVAADMVNEAICVSYNFPAQRKKDDNELTVALLRLAVECRD